MLSVLYKAFVKLAKFIVFVYFPTAFPTQQSSSSTQPFEALCQQTSSGISQAHQP